MQKKGKGEEEAFYVGVKDPIEIRRSLLESSKEAVQYLQRAERFKAIRTEKSEHISKLKGTVKELQRLVRKLKTVLPKTKLRTILHEKEKKLKREAIKKKVKSEAVKKQTVVKEEVAVKEEKKEMTELEKLESELGAIESILSTLS